MLLWIVVTNFPVFAGFFIFQKNHFQKNHFFFRHKNVEPFYHKCNIDKLHT